VNGLKKGLIAFFQKCNASVSKQLTINNFDCAGPHGRNWEIITERIAPGTNHNQRNNLNITFSEVDNYICNQVMNTRKDIAELTSLAAAGGKSSMLFTLICIQKTWNELYLNEVKQLTNREHARITPAESTNLIKNDKEAQISLNMRTGKAEDDIRESIPELARREFVRRGKVEKMDFPGVGDYDLWEDVYMEYFAFGEYSEVTLQDINTYILIKALQSDAPEGNFVGTGLMHTQITKLRKYMEGAEPRRGLFTQAIVDFQAFWKRNT